MQDVLGHVSDWERYAVDGLDAMAAGRVAGAEYDGNEDQWNHEHAAARRGQEWMTAWEDLEATRRELLARLDGMTDTNLARAVRTRWSDTDTPYGWIRVCLEHDREHAESMRETLTARRQTGERERAGLRREVRPVYERPKPPPRLLPAQAVADAEPP